MIEVEELVLLEVVSAIGKVFDWRNNFLLANDVILTGLRQLDHILDVLLSRTVQREKTHLVGALFKGPSLEVIFNLAVLTAVLGKQLTHLLRNHVFGVGVDMGEGNERDIVIGVALVRGLLVLVLTGILVVRERHSRVVLAELSHWTDSV